MNLLYYTDKNLNSISTIVTDSFELNGKCYARLNDCIYYPQGGGQKGDKGILLLENGEQLNIINTIKDENGYPLLVLDRTLEKETKVDCSLDREFRDKQMKMHTALHLLHCFFEEYLNADLTYPSASNIEADFAYNKYPKDTISEQMLTYASKRFEEITASDQEVTTYPDENNPMFRYWKCGRFTIPCGGIHVSALKEIGPVELQMHTKKDTTTIKLFLK